MKILITGAAGYIGGLAVERFLSAGNQILALDKKEFQNKIQSPSIQYFQFDLTKDAWEEKIGKVDVVIHCAFDIKSHYGKIQDQHFNNLECCKRIWQYCFKNNVAKLVYLSSAAAYGAKPENIGKLLKETDSLTENIYPYGSDKREAEEIFVKTLKENQTANLKTYFLRLATVNGEKGKKRSRNLFSFLKGTPILPYADKNSARQYINEKDVVAAIDFLINRQDQPIFEIYNLAPSDILTLKDMAKLQKKMALRIPKWLVRLAFYLNWHILRGKIFATAPGSANSFIYPSNMDGSKITKIGFKYSKNSLETFQEVAK